MPSRLYETDGLSPLHIILGEQDLFQVTVTNRGLEINERLILLIGLLKSRSVARHNAKSYW